eukprot:CAMPEP_0118825446 /NCGR_PEP_ID=MMETSP1162-20130426/11308_1 /TAXON_ID=33656 /ORGANISM="Phaeocystis Sp, Strain CCMP2710" /LENGTH=180 /DNA_ID=CAMNT_0006756129 /DNA_START=60 /DNA_END=602 /DNA_ORIENTATION=+
MLHDTTDLTHPTALGHLQHHARRAVVPHGEIGGVHLSDPLLQGLVMCRDVGAHGPIEGHPLPADHSRLERPTVAIHVAPGGVGPGGGRGARSGAEGGAAVTFEHVPRQLALGEAVRKHARPRIELDLVLHELRRTRATHDHASTAVVPRRTRATPPSVGHPAVAIAMYSAIAHPTCRPRP